MNIKSCVAVFGLMIVGLSLTGCTGGSEAANVSKSEESAYRNPNKNPPPEAGAGGAPAGQPAPGPGAPPPGPPAGARAGSS